MLLLFGDHIYSVDVKGKMFIWAFKGVDENLAPIGSISLDDGYGPSCIMHPDTYVNKVNFLALISFPLSFLLVSFVF